MIDKLFSKHRLAFIVAITAGFSSNTVVALEEGTTKSQPTSSEVESSKATTGEGATKSQASNGDNEKKPVNDKKASAEESKKSENSSQGTNSDQTSSNSVKTEAAPPAATGGAVTSQPSVEGKTASSNKTPEPESSDSSLESVETKTETTDIDEQEDNVEVIEVLGVRSSLSTSQLEEQLADQQMDMITADEFADMPDSNLAETLETMPGMTIERDENGEGSVARLRGMTIDSISVDGMPMAGTGSGGGDDLAESEGFSFQDISNDMIDSIQVVTSPTAADDESGLAGFIRIKTKDPSDIAAPTVSVQIGVNHDAVTETPDPRWAVSAGTAIGLRSGRRLGVTAGFSHQQSETGGVTVQLGGYGLFQPRPGGPDPVFDYNRNGVLDYEDYAVFPYNTTSTAINSQYIRNSGRFGLSLQWSKKLRFNLNYTTFTRQSRMRRNLINFAADPNTSTVMPILDESGEPIFQRLLDYVDIDGNERQIPVLSAGIVTNLNKIRLGTQSAGGNNPQHNQETDSTTENISFKAEYRSEGHNVTFQMSRSSAATDIQRMATQIIVDGVNSEDIYGYNYNLADGDFDLALTRDGIGYGADFNDYASLVSEGTELVFQDGTINYIRRLNVNDNLRFDYSRNIDWGIFTKFSAGFSENKKTNRTPYSSRFNLVNGNGVNDHFSRLRRLDQDVRALYPRMPFSGVDAATLDGFAADGIYPQAEIDRLRALPAGVIENCIGSQDFNQLLDSVSPFDNWLTYTCSAEETLENFNIVPEDHVANEEVYSVNTGNQNENIKQAVYFMFNFEKELGDMFLSGNAGVRYQPTRSTSKLRFQTLPVLDQDGMVVREIPGDPTSRVETERVRVRIANTGKNAPVLPRINFKLRTTSWLTIRAAYSRNIGTQDNNNNARTFKFLDPLNEENEVNGRRYEVETNNPGLRNTQADIFTFDFDLHPRTNIEGFQLKFSPFINRRKTVQVFEVQDFEFGNDTLRTRVPLRVSSSDQTGSVRGFTFGLRSKLTFIPPSWGTFMFNGNYTKTIVTEPSATGPNTSFDIFGQPLVNDKKLRNNPEHTANINIAFKRQQFSGTFRINHRVETYTSNPGIWRIDELRLDPEGRTTVDGSSSRSLRGYNSAQTSANMSLTYQFSKGFKMSLNINNIFAETRNSYLNYPDMPLKFNNFGRSYALSINYKVL